MLGSPPILNFLKFFKRMLLTKDKKELILFKKTLTYFERLRFADVLEGNNFEHPEPAEPKPAGTRPTRSPQRPRGRRSGGRGIL